MKPTLQIEIPRRNALCSAGAEPFAADMPYYSYLFDDDDQLTRCDYCEACKDKAQRKGAIAEWKGVVPRKEVKKKPVSRNEQALQLFRETYGQDEETAFVLALYLARQKILLPRKEMKKNGEEFFLYEFPSAEEIFPVKKITLSISKIEELQQTIAKKLSGAVNDSN